jgi:hypothetical protein
MHGASQVFRCLQLALDERLVDHYLGSDIGEFATLPRLYLLSASVRNCAACDPYPPKCSRSAKMTWSVSPKLG